MRMTPKTVRKWRYESEKVHHLPSQADIINTYSGFYRSKQCLQLL